MLRDIADALPPFYGYYGGNRIRSFSREPFCLSMRRIIEERTPNIDGATDEIRKDIKEFTERFVSFLCAIADPDGLKSLRSWNAVDPADTVVSILLVADFIVRKKMEEA